MRGMEEGCCDFFAGGWGFLGRLGGGVSRILVPLSHGIEIRRVRVGKWYGSVFGGRVVRCLPGIRRRRVWIGGTRPRVFGGSFSFFVWCQCGGVSELGSSEVAVWSSVSHMCGVVCVFRRRGGGCGVNTTLFVSVSVSFGAWGAAGGAGVAYRVGRGWGTWFPGFWVSWEGRGVGVVVILGVLTDGSSSGVVGGLRCSIGFVLVLGILRGGLAFCGRGGVGCCRGRGRGRVWLLGGRGCFGWGVV